MAAGLLAGSCAVLLLPQSPAPAFIGGVLAAGAMMAIAMRRAWPLGPALGFLLTASYLQSALDQRLDPALEGEKLRIRGVVVSVPQGTLQTLRFRFLPEALLDAPGHLSAKRGAGIAEASQAPLPPLIELTWYDAPSRVEAAETLELDVKLRRPRGFANPGGQDNAARMLRDGVGASGYVRSGERHGRERAAYWRYPVLLARAHVAGLIRDELGDRPSAGIVAGLAVGLQDALSREQWQVLARSGTSHLMAISGLHIAMVGAVFAWLGAAWQRWRQRRGATGARRDAAVIAGFVASLVYSLLAGWSVPTQRTMVMIACGAATLLLRRRVGVADGLGFCVIAVLLLDPLAPLAPGFWLSFGAVAAILYAATGFVHHQGLVRSYLRVQWIVTVGLLPALAGSFGAVSLVSVLVNLYAIPLYTLAVVPAVLVSCAVVVIERSAGAVLLDWTGRLIEVTWPLLEIPAAWPLATWSIAALEPVAWVALIVGTVAAISPLPRLGRIAGVVLAVTACAWRPPLVTHGAARVTVLDVGQGLAVVVETRQHTLVYDTGPSFRAGSDTGQLVVVPFLKSRGLRGIDRMVVSHDDDDHKGGVASVLALMPTRELLLGPSLDASFAAREHVVARERCARGDEWEWDGVTFRWLHPGDRRFERDNDSSCVLLIVAGDHTVLIAGDIEAEAERDLLAAGLMRQVDVIVVPHHGSRTSSTAAFVAATSPQWVIYAVGHRNRWNFPHPRVAERWQQAGANALQTSREGAITFELRPGQALPEPVAWRLAARRPWRDP